MASVAVVSPVLNNRCFPGFDDTEVVIPPVEHTTISDSGEDEIGGRHSGRVWTTGTPPHSRPSRAVSRNETRRTPSVFGVRRDGFEHEVKSVGAVGLAATQ